MMKFTIKEYDSAKHILAIPDHYVAIARTAEKATAAGGMVVSENGRFIIKAGTVYPANDATAIGVVLNDYDVTDGDAMMAVVMHGFIKTAALPVAPALTVDIPMIKFVETII